MTPEQKRMIYEQFLRDAFKCDRGQDPGCLANSDLFDNSLDTVKVGVGYAAAIHLAHKDESSFGDWSQRIVGAKNGDEIIAIVSEIKKL